MVLPPPVFIWSNRQRVVSSAPLSLPAVRAVVAAAWPSIREAERGESVRERPDLRRHVDAVGAGRREVEQHHGSFRGPFGDAARELQQRELGGPGDDDGGPFRGGAIGPAAGIETGGPHGGWANGSAWAALKKTR